MNKTFSLDDIAFLTSARGRALLDDFHAEPLSERDLLRLVPRLRKTYTPEETSAAIETAQLRRRAVRKFGDDAAHMLFTADALEQASDPQVRRYRAEKTAALTGGPVVDAGCGIGADLLALARAGLTVRGVELDPVRVAMARHNMAALGIHADISAGDVTQGLPAGPLVFIDPARRDDRGRRITDVSRYIPPLSVIDGWLQAGRQVVAKLAPGVDVAQVRDYGGQLEFISVGGALKEAVLWAGGTLTGRRATLIADGGVHHLDTAAAAVDVAAPRAWLCEPDAAAIRAGAVAQIAAACGGTLLDPSIAYFTTDTRPASPWVRAWRVLGWLPFHLKKLRAALKAANVGPLTVKKRGSPLSPEELIARLKLKGDEPRTLVLTQHAGQPVVLICADIAPSM